MIPAALMKMRRAHLVPLSKQALAALRELQSITGGYTLAFPGRNDPAKPMSEAAINQLLKRSGYDGRATGHGFRHTMSTTLHEQGYPSEWVETQLAHVDKNSIRGTYNHAQYLEGGERCFSGMPTIWMLCFPTVLDLLFPRKNGVRCMNDDVMRLLDLVKEWAICYEVDEQDVAHDLHELIKELYLEYGVRQGKLALPSHVFWVGRAGGPQPSVRNYKLFSKG